MSNIIKIIFENYTYIEKNSNGIDLDRYIIPFSLVVPKDAPLKDISTKHKIIVTISGTILSMPRLWNFKKSDIPKVIYIHACEYIKASILDNRIRDKYELDLDRRRLERYRLDVKKIPDISKFECTIDITQQKKIFGFRP